MPEEPAKPPEGKKGKGKKGKEKYVKPLTFRPEPDVEKLLLVELNKPLAPSLTKIVNEALRRMLPKLENHRGNGADRR